jgi:hypothetical protein
MVRLDRNTISETWETWDSDDLITEALNELGESDETEGLAEACELLDLISEATTSALEKPLRNAHKGELGKFVKAGGGDRRAALLAKIAAKADREGARADLSTKGKATTSYWNKIKARVGHLQAKHSAAGGGGDEGHELTAKRLQQKRDSTRNTEGARGKKSGDTWKTSTGHIGGKNSSGEIRYFRDESAARDYAHS